MKNLLLSILVLVGTINYDKVLAAVKIPKVGFITKIISKNITSKALSKRSASQTALVTALLIPNSSASYQDNSFKPQTVGQKIIKPKTNIF